MPSLANADPISHYTGGLTRTHQVSDHAIVADAYVQPCSTVVSGDSEAPLLDDSPNALGEIAVDWPRDQATSFDTAAGSLIRMYCIRPVFAHAGASRILPVRA
jgi:hypothetical protein